MLRRSVGKKCQKEDIKILLGRGGGPVVGVIAYYTDVQSSSLFRSLKFLLLSPFWKERKQTKWGRGFEVLKHLQKHLIVVSGKTGASKLFYTTFENFKFLKMINYCKSNSKYWQLWLARSHKSSPRFFRFNTHLGTMWCKNTSFLSVSKWINIVWFNSS